MSDQMIVAGRSRAGRPRGASCADGGGPFRPGLRQARPDPGGRPHHAALRWHDRRARRPPRGAARHHHRADRAERCRQDHLLQPDHRLRQPELGEVGRHWSFDGRKLDKTSASSVALAGMVRTFQLTKALNRMTVMDNMTAGRPQAARREAAHVPCSSRPGGRRRRRSRPRPRTCSTGSSSTPKKDDYRRQPVGRPAQAARDGAGPDERPDHDHARRADGRREPRADPVAARAHRGPSRRGHDGAVRRARHAHRPAHLRLGGRDGRGPHRRRGARPTPSWRTRPSSTPTWAPTTTPTSATTRCSATRRWRRWPRRSRPRREREGEQ